jgi:hypothetical protein
MRGIISAVLPEIEEAAIRQTNEKTISPLLYRIRFKIIAFTTGVTAIFDTEFVPVQWTYHIANGIDITIGQDATGMWAFISEAKPFLLVFANTYLLAGYFYHGNKIITYRQFGFTFGNLMPFVFFVRCAFH